MFDRISQAYKVLSDPQSRAGYESTLMLARLGALADSSDSPPSEPQPPVEVPPEEGLAKAEEAFGAGNYWDAIQQLEDVAPRLGGRQRQKARVLLAQCYLKNPKWRKLAEDELMGVIQEDPENADAHFLLGTIYKSGGLGNRAAAMFRKVLELKPRHAEAQTELESLPPEPSPKAGLLKRLFG